MTKEQADIITEPTQFDITIKKLKADNQEIESKIEEINQLIKSIDETKWKAPERAKVDEQLIPFIDKKKNTITTNINNCTTLLQTALNRYLLANTEIKKAANDLNTLGG